MKILPIILKKKSGQVLTRADFAEVVNGYIKHEVHDQELAVFLMVLCFRSPNDQEVLAFFDAIYQVSRKITFPAVTGFKLDKHSTGGIGDKGTLILVPFLRYFGIKMFKYSGRTLGFTGGTVDKLDSIRGMEVDFTFERFQQLTEKISIVVANTNKAISPFETATYRLRSQTGSLESIALVTISVMIKKILLKNDALLIDLKVGSGAFLKTIAEANEFARLAKLIANNYQRRIRIVFSDMNQLCDNYIGNKAEVYGVHKFFQSPNHYPRLKTHATVLAANALVLAKMISYESAVQLVEKVWQTPEHLLFHFQKFIEGQNGDFADVKPPVTRFRIDVIAQQHGYWSFVNLTKLGILFNRLSFSQGKTLDFDAGIKVRVSAGQLIDPGTKIMTLYTNLANLDSGALLREAAETFTITPERPVVNHPVLKFI